MPVLQQYYTSFRDENTGRLGLGIKATSPGISSELQKAIDKLISYRIPPSLDERAISSHPVALRYQYNNPGESIFLCSQSIGSDVNGRPGNFFAHTVIMEPDMFASSPPILFWNSPFWQTKDAESRSHIDSLPVLDSFNVEPSFDIEGIWDFLAQGNRRVWLYKLLCAVVHANKTYRRIVIQDSTENVVWWIAIVSSLLPPDYRPLLSFSTYHYDPMQSPFMITGVPKDAPLGNYGSYFVLNAWDGLCSEVADSLYARVVTDSAHPDSFAEQLLPLLTFAKRFPKPTVIDEQLDMVMLYARIQVGRDSVMLSPEELRVIQLALQSIEQLPDLAPDEAGELNPLEELEHLRGVLAEALRLQQSPDVAAQYQRIERLLKNHSANEELQAVHQTLDTLERLQHFKPEDIEELHRIQASLAESARQQQSQVHYATADRVTALLQKQKAIVVGRLQKDLQAFVELLAQSGGQGVNTSRFSQLQQFYEYALLVEQINQQAFLQSLLPVLWNGNSSMILATWQCLGRYIEPGPQGQVLLSNSLQVVDRLLNAPQRFNDGNTLLDAIYEAMAQTGRQLVWFNLAVQSSSQLPEAVLLNFYYRCVNSLELDQRLPYRNIMATLVSNINIILNHEIVNDVYNANSHGLAAIEHWVRYARLQRYNVNALLEAGLVQLQKMSNQQQWRELAPSILLSPDLAPSLPITIEEQLVQLVLPTLSLNKVSPTNVDLIELCERYHNNQTLSEDTRTTLDTILAMVSGKMDEKLAQRIQQQVNILLPHEYISSIQRFFPEFLQHAVTPESHQNMISAFFTRNFGYDNDFWKTYLGDTGAFTRLFLQSTMTEEAVNILDNWFAFRPGNFQQPYVVQEFFLKLPMTLAHLEQSGKFSEVASNFTQLVQKRSWYPVVQAYFPEKSSMLGAAAGKVKGIILSLPWQKPKPSGGEELEAQKEQFGNNVANLFEGDKKRVVTKHEVLSRVYIQLPEYFWEYYWEQFHHMVASGDVDLILEVLSFWFDKSFATLGKGHYLPQTFFFGLFNALAIGRRQPAFSGIAWKIAEKVEKQKKDQYPWYPLVRDFFPQPGK